MYLCVGGDGGGVAELERGVARHTGIFSDLQWPASVDFWCPTYIYRVFCNR